MTQHQAHERIAGLHFAMLMMRLGVGIRGQQRASARKARKTGATRMNAGFHGSARQPPYPD